MSEIFSSFQYKYREIVRSDDPETRSIVSIEDAWFQFISYVRLTHDFAFCLSCKSEKQIERERDTEGGRERACEYTTVSICGSHTYWFCYLPVCATIYRSLASKFVVVFVFSHFLRRSQFTIFYVSGAAHSVEILSSIGLKVVYFCSAAAQHKQPASIRFETEIVQNISISVILLSSADTHGTNSMWFFTTWIYLYEGIGVCEANEIAILNLVKFIGK